MEENKSLEVQVIEKAIRAFSDTEVSDTRIAEIKAFTSSLSISGIDDKEGYQLVDKARKRVKQLRLQVAKKESDLLELPKKYTKAVKAEAARLIGQLKPIEDDLQVKQKAIDDQIAEIRRQEELKAATERKRIADREQALFAAGCLRDGAGNFVGGTWKVTPDQVCDTADDEFNLLVIAISQSLAPEPEPEPEPVVSILDEPAVPAAPVSRQEPVKVAAAPVTHTRQVQTQTPAAQPAAQRKVNDPQYVAGFHAAKQAVLRILQSPDKFTRAQLIELINGLRP